MVDSPRSGTDINPNNSGGGNSLGPTPGIIPPQAELGHGLDSVVDSPRSGTDINPNNSGGGNSLGPTPGIIPPQAELGHGLDSALSQMEIASSLSGADQDYDEITSTLSRSTAADEQGAGELAQVSGEDYTWDFLGNAAQMFDRTPELTHVTSSDIRKGFDMQGYKWHGSSVQRRLYMNYRRQAYPQFFQRCTPSDLAEIRSHAGYVTDLSCEFYGFRYSAIGEDYGVQVNHFQLRDLLAAPSNYDVVFGHADGIRNWNPSTRTLADVVRWDELPSGFRLSALCVDNGVVFAGDCKGRFCVKSLWTGQIESGSICANGDIVNHAAFARSNSLGGELLVASNNGEFLTFDVGRLECTRRAGFEWAVNCVDGDPGNGNVACVVGDCTDGLLVDSRTCGAVVRRLCGHRDYSFSCAFSPDGNMVATGNQDTTTRVWDLRWPEDPLAVLPGYLGASRVVEFSSSGRHLISAEPADYVHVYDVGSGFTRAQEIEVFGEIAGVAFSPDANCLFMAVADSIHGSSLAEFNLVN